MDYRVYKNVTFKGEFFVGDHAQIGYFYRDAHKNEDLETIIGERAHIRSQSVIYFGNTIGSDFSTGHGVMIREHNTIGDRVSVGTHSIVEHHTTIHDDVRIHSNSFIPEFSILERGVWIGPCVCVTNAKYPASKKAKQHLQRVTIKEYAKIGANTTVLPGVIIGKHALVGAGSIVTKDVPDHAVVFGAPARVHGTISDLSYANDSKEKPYSASKENA